MLLARSDGHDEHRAGDVSHNCGHVSVPSCPADDAGDPCPVPLRHRLTVVAWQVRRSGAATEHVTDTSLGSASRCARAGDAPRTVWSAALLSHGRRAT